jgi:dGTP triphosphohydrolase
VDVASVSLLSELQISNIETNKLFTRLAEKTQVTFPRPGQSEVIRNRQSHSFEVATSASIMAISIAELNNWSPLAVDYKGSVKPCSLLHDIGHASLGHSGNEYLDKYFKGKGLKEGFSDNNNTLTVIRKNNIIVSDYTISSVIKYPHKLYPSQKKRYLKLLAESIAQDKAHFASLGLNLVDQKRTVACQVMDEADRNTYICSDLADFLCLGNTLPVETIKRLASEAHLACRYTELNSLLSVLRSCDKTAIKAYFNNLKNQFNMNYTLTSNGLTVINQDLHDYREFLWTIEYDYYIDPIRKKRFHLDNMQKFADYISRVVDDEFFPSRHYSKAIREAKSKKARLRALRDMIAEATDTFVTKDKEITPL